MKLTAYTLYQDFQNNWIPVELELEKFGKEYKILKVTEKEPETKNLAIDSIYQSLIERT